MLPVMDSVVVTVLALEASAMAAASVEVLSMVREPETVSLL
jgi:hypothetical protein